MDGKPEGELSRHDPRTRPCSGCRIGCYQGRQGLGRESDLLFGYGRLPIDGRARHPDNSPRIDAVGSLRYRGYQGRCLWHLFEWHARRSVSRGGPARSNVYSGAHDRQVSRQTPNGPGRCPHEEFHSEVRKRAHGANRPVLRQRRLRGSAQKAGGARRIQRPAAAASGRPEERPLPRSWCQYIR